MAERGQSQVGSMLFWNGSLASFGRADRPPVCFPRRFVRGLRAAGRDLQRLGPLLGGLLLAEVTWTLALWRPPAGLWACSLPPLLEYGAKAISCRASMPVGLDVEQLAYLSRSPLAVILDAP